jgi:aspartyl protease family protein
MENLYRILETATPFLGHLPPLVFAAVAAMVLIIGGGMVAGRAPRAAGAVRFAGNGLLLTVFCLAVLRMVRLDPTFDTLGASIALPTQTVAGGETRIPLSADGHYWIEARVNGSKQRFMVDTGATVTTLSEQSASEAAITPDPLRLPVVVRTANGSIEAQMARAKDLRFGSIAARDMDVIVTGATGGLNVLGMNFLSRLKSWRVEDGVLVLVPNHPQGADTARG